MTLAYRILPSPVGTLTLVAREEGLAAILWENDEPGRVRLGPCDVASDHPVLEEAARQLAAYFAGRLRLFTLPLAPAGTPFQLRVWRALAEIPYGETRTYGAIAAALGEPKAVRAVGAANGRNPLSIVLPCHRVVGADGTLTGFAGGLAAKALLLRLEGAQFRDALPGGPSQRLPDLFATEARSGPDGFTPR